MGETDPSDRASRKLSLIASLLIDVNENLGKKLSIKEKVAYLVSRGVTEDRDIAEILNITKGHASKEKALLKKRDV
ncbi:MAG: hypothetical protein KGH57_00910 [Candidatus Micrarchaeota archaeon]|nr:hypothetical protein [Candidatus Micrarchaeota archaeon]